jgi:hypothetical protein
MAQGSQPKPASKLLIEEPPLQVLPTLAQRIGLNEAIVLQQIHYWSRGKGDGWVYNSVAQWRGQFPFWSERTIRRILHKLEYELGLIDSRQPEQYNRRKHYRIHYEDLPTDAANLAASDADDLAASYTENPETSKNMSRPGDRDERFVGEEEAPHSHLLAELLVNPPQSRIPLAWAKHEWRMVEQDGRDSDDIEALIRFAATDDHWEYELAGSSNPMAKLRFGWDSIERDAIDYGVLA